MKSPGTSTKPLRLNEDSLLSTVGSHSWKGALCPSAKLGTPKYNISHWKNRQPHFSFSAKPHGDSSGMYPCSLRGVYRVNKPITVMGSQKRRCVPQASRPQAHHCYQSTGCGRASKLAPASWWRVWFVDCVEIVDAKPL